MSNLNRKQIAAYNTFRCLIEGHDHYWCYICKRCLNHKVANIDHIRPISCFSNIEKSKPTFKKYGDSFNSGLGVVKSFWWDEFCDSQDKASWHHNNLVLTHKKCNELKENNDYTNVYIDLLKKGNSFNMKDKILKIGQIYGLWDNNDDYHPYLIIAATPNRTYLLQGSLVKLKYIGHSFQETNIFEEQGRNSYVLRNYYYNENLKYKTAFLIQTLFFDKEKENQIKENQKLLGVVSEEDYYKIQSLLLEINWKNSSFISDKHFKQILEQQIYLHEWNWK